MKELSTRQLIAGAVLIVVLAVLFVPIILLLESADDAPVVPAPERATADEMQRGVDAHAQQLLTKYEWIDREQGRVRIPVERARALWLNENGGPR
jgi:hypothetical protein